MRFLLVTILALVLGLPSFGQGKDYSDLTTIYRQGKSLADSLVASGVDTLISCTEGHAGCFGTRPLSIIYWKHKGVTTTVIYKEELRTKKKKHFVTMSQSVYIGKEYSTEFLEKYFDKIAKDTLRPYRYLIDYSFTEIRAQLGNRTLLTTIVYPYKLPDSLSYLLAFRDNFLLYYYTLAAR
jgi:hypothetical protein